MRTSTCLLALFLSLLSFDCTTKPSAEDLQREKVDKYLSQYAPYEMSFDASGYSDNDKQILKNLVRAAEYIDTIYWLQTSQYGMFLRDSLRAASGNELATKLLTLIERNAGPFEQLNDRVPFMGDETYYPGEELYPPGMSVEQFDTYYATLPDSEQQQFISPYTVIVEDRPGKYRTVPYHVMYEKYLTPIVALLNESAELTDNPSFAHFLRLKAVALTTDKYFDADAAWIDMEGSKFDIVFGPFETYSDGIKGVKAKYEASIEVVDQEESKRLDLYTKHLAEMEENLPVPQEYKSVVKGLTAKFVIVRDIIRKGEAGVGYQAVATNLPNDPEVHATKGTKKTFWKNMFEARFSKVIRPVAMRLIDEDLQPYLSDQGFFQFVLMHEICHAIGPRTVKVGAKKGMAANAAIGPSYNALEEAKADIVGLYSLMYLMDNGVVDKEREKEFFVSYLGSLFRSIRFGLNQAHGKAAAVSLNYLSSQGGVGYDDQTKKWSIDFPKFRDGIKSLSRELVVLLGDGDATKVDEFFAKHTVMSPSLQESLDLVEDIAIDVIPTYSIKWN